MAKPKPSYRTQEEADQYLASEGFFFIQGQWECDMSNDGGGKVCAIVALQCGEYVIRHWDEE